MLIILLLGTATYWVTDTSVVSTDVVDIGDRKKPVTPPVDLRMLAEQFGSSPVLTPEQIEEDKQIDDEQVATAGEWLRSIDVQERIDGAEQLAAYPTAEAEKLLVEALITDIDPEVRSTAAQSLSAFESPTDETIAALLAAVEDENEEVRLSALDTLESIATAEETGSRRYKKILAGLKKAAKSKRVPSETREEIRDFLLDQASDR
ncbi:HEAT repeat domain-containing protein [Methylocaldum szegediense]|uniref:HEAT repeat domain-containing protein n=1 Tax=Methylocaldum szegediense TaxID=73780 RepID=UPI0004040F7D|nr:HEAT repeat domain-containing protein [Methylocaldum szegediense]